MTNKQIQEEIQETEELISEFKRLLDLKEGSKRSIARIERELIIEKDRLVRLTRKL